MCGEACSHLVILLQQKHALGPKASRLERHAIDIAKRLSSLLTRDGLRAKHIVTPIKLAAALVRVLRASDQSALASKVAGALSPAVSLASSSYASAKAVASQLAQLTRALAQAQTG